MKTTVVNVVEICIICIFATLRDFLDDSHLFLNYHDTFVVSFPAVMQNRCMIGLLDADVINPHIVSLKGTVFCMLLRHH